MGNVTVTFRLLLIVNVTLTVLWLLLQILVENHIVICSGSRYATSELFIDFFLSHSAAIVEILIVDYSSFKIINIIILSCDVHNVKFQRGRQDS